MATIQIDIPDASLARVRDAVAAAYGYSATIPNVDGTTSPNPQTKTQFVKQVIANLVKNIVKNYEADRDSLVARQSAISSVDAINIT